MTDEQKYNELLKEIGEVISRKNSEIMYLQFRCEELEKALKKAEEQLENAVANRAASMLTGSDL